MSIDQNTLIRPVFTPSVHSPFLKEYLSENYQIQQHSSGSRIHPKERIHLNEVPHYVTLLSMDPILNIQPVT